MAFDENKYKAIFESRYGAGAYESGMQQARSVGRSKVEASTAMAQLKKSREADLKKTYQDAISYWNDPMNKSTLKQQGAIRAVNELKNDPAKQAEIESQGYVLSDYIDGMYHAASDGKYRSEREYGQFYDQLNKDTKAKNKAADEKSKSQTGMTVQEAYDFNKEQQKQLQKKKSELTGMDRFKNILGIDLPKEKQKTLTKKTQVKKQPSNERKGLLGALDRTVGRASDNATRTLFGNEFSNAQNQNYANNAQDKLKNNPGDKRAIQSLQMLNAVNRPAQGKVEKVADFVGKATGELAPYTIGGAYGAADALLGKVGLNALKSPLAKDLIRGGIAGTISGSEKAVAKKVASNENTPLKNIGIEAAFAGGGDAALGGLLRNLNLKGQTFGLADDVANRYAQNIGASTGRTPEQMALAMRQTVIPKNVFADPTRMPKEMPKPIEKPLNISTPPPKPVETPKMNNGLDEWVNFAQQGQGPQARGQQQASIGRYTKEALSQQGDSILNRADAFKNAPEGGYNNRLLAVQKEMQTAGDKRGIYRQPLSPDELYLRAKQPGDPATFDELIKLAGMEHSSATAPKDLTRLLDSDPRIKEGIRGLNDLLKPINTPKPTVPRVGPMEDLLKPLNANPKVSSGNTSIDEAMKQLSDKYKGQGKGSQEPFLQELEKIYENYSPNPSELGKSAKIGPKANQSPADILKESLRSPGQEGKLLTDSKPLLLPLKPTVLKTVKTSKSPHSMSKEELQSIYQQLKTEQTSLLSGKGDKKQIAAVKEDMKKVENLLVRLDLQLFGEKAVKPIPPKLPSFKESSPLKVGESVTPQPVKSSGDGLMDVQAEANNVISDDLAKEIQDIKDITSPQVGTKNIYELVDRLPKEMGDTIKTSLDTGKKNYVTHLEQLTNDLYENVVQRLGIKPGSKESKLVQDYGEKTIVKKYLHKQGIDHAKLSNEELAAINLEQLKKVYPSDWERVVEADQYFRDNYDQLIDQVNVVRKQVYPTSPDKIVPKRTDYYHHFNELEGFEGVKNLFDTPSNIDPHLEGVSPYTKPKTKWQGFMQKRGLGPYKSDAVGGFLKYIKASSHSINIDPVIPLLRKTVKTLADATTDSRNANKIIQSLEMNAGDLAGKTNPYDRLLQLGVGRKGERILNWVNSRVKSNMVLGNLSSALGQFGNVPLAVGKAKVHAVPGLMDTLEQTTKEIFRAEKTAPIYQSTFIKERYADALFRRFDQKLLQQPKKLAVWMLETTDKAGTRFTWNSMYRKGLKEGVEDVIKYADYETRKIVAGRGVGEVPLLQKSKTMQIFAPFTLEVGNQWKVLREMVGEKDAAGIMTALIASYGLNKAIEQVRGSGVSFDPIDAVLDGYTRKDGTTGDKVLNSAASLTGEVVGNVPGGNLLTQMVNTDKKVPFTELQFKELFGERNPNRFGTGLALTKGLSNPLFYVAPFGGSQIDKTYKGINAARDHGVYKGTEKSQIKFPIKTGLLKDLQLTTMGPNSVSEARDYYNNNSRPLSEKQTLTLNQVPTGQKQDVYKSLMQQRNVQTIQEKIKDVQKDDSLTQVEKQRELLRLMNELSKIQ